MSHRETTYLLKTKTYHANTSLQVLMETVFNLKVWNTVNSNAENKMSSIAFLPEIRSEIKMILKLLHISMHKLTNPSLQKVPSKPHTFICLLKLLYVLHRDRHEQGAPVVVPVSVTGYIILIINLPWKYATNSYLFLCNTFNVATVSASAAWRCDSWLFTRSHASDSLCPRHGAAFRDFRFGAERCLLGIHI